eukprot:c18167_g1_i1 orf=144-1178(+)
MASSPKKDQGRGRKRPSKYSLHGSKKRKYLELRSGLQGFLITCEGGREHQSSREAIQVLERFYDTLCEEKGGSVSHEEISGLDADQQHDSYNSKTLSSVCDEASPSSDESDKEDEDKGAIEKTSTDDPKASVKKANIACLLEEEIAELRDKKQARFASLETGCNGVIFIRMLKGDAERGPNQVVQAIMQNCIRMRKPLTRFCLRFLPIEVTCYASADEVRKMAERFISQHFPVAEKDKALKFAVVYEARANTSLDRMEIINTVAKLVAPPHSVDLKNPDKTILVQIVKTICAIGVVSNYKQYAKYNIRELTSSKQESKQELASPKQELKPELTSSPKQGSKQES